ncbi:armadillo repeat-containing protein 6 homolog [Anoplophora glabripennis]|uniref:Armadillo repeat-containing protein n=1 Tax=Anoplophora glabripennis TaxID=217634 RepID=V5FZ23_ANOGL|nr:armadillo repeat-containing protein 6 homolog [Anoplophora glabripennis]
MVLVISQETFNDAVRENIEDLGLTPDEALKEAVVQFESQGVDLSSIIKELMLEPKSSDAIEDRIKQLNNLNKSKAPAKEILEILEALKAECDKGIQYRVIAGQHDAYPILLDTLFNYSGNVEVERISIRTLISLMTKQPDLLDDRGIEAIFCHLDKNEDLEVKRLTLKWAKECCVMHEKNRQNIFDANILEKIKELLHEGSPDILKETMGVCRALVLDDDIRVEFGKAHEHARVIASECLCLLTNLLNRFRHDEQLICDLMQTFSVLLVRTEFCKKVVDAGGLDLIKEVITAFPSSQKVHRQCFKLLKSLAGNDECKYKIIQNDLAPIIVAALDASKGNVQTATAGLAATAAICLRSPDNSTELFKANVPNVIVEIMKLYPNEKLVQKTASWAIRNMVSRSKYQCDKFLSLGLEELLQKNLKKFKEIEYDTKAALRDLGCKVKLNEEWTGKGGLLNTEATTRKS